MDKETNRRTKSACKKCKLRSRTPQPWLKGTANLMPSSSAFDLLHQSPELVNILSGPRFLYCMCMFHQPIHHSHKNSQSKKSNSTQCDREEEKEQHSTNMFVFG